MDERTCIRVITVDVTSSLQAENKCSAVAMWMVRHKHQKKVASLPKRFPPPSSSPKIGSSPLLSQKKSSSKQNPPHPKKKVHRLKGSLPPSPPKKRFPPLLTPKTPSPKKKRFVPHQKSFTFLTAKENHPTKKRFSHHQKNSPSLLPKKILRLDPKKVLLSETNVPPHPNKSLSKQKEFTQKSNIE